MKHCYVKYFVSEIYICHTLIDSSYVCARARTHTHTHARAHAHTIDN